MSQLITPPDFPEQDLDAHSILLIDPEQPTIEIIIAACRTFNKDYNVYICSQKADPEWLSKAISKVNKVFINEGYEVIVNYLKEQDA